MKASVTRLLKVLFIVALMVLGILVADASFPFIDEVGCSYRYQRDEKRFIEHFNSKGSEVVSFFEKLDLGGIEELSFEGGNIGITASIEIDDTTIKLVNSIFSDLRATDYAYIEPMFEDNFLSDSIDNVTELIMPPIDRAFQETLLSNGPWRVRFFGAQRHKEVAELVEKCGMDKLEFEHLRTQMIQLGIWQINEWAEGVLIGNYRGNEYEGFRYIFNPNHVEIRNDCRTEIFRSDPVIGAFDKFDEACSELASFSCGYPTYYCN